MSITTQAEEDEDHESRRNSYPAIKEDLAVAGDHNDSVPMRAMCCGPLVRMAWHSSVDHEGVELGGQYRTYQDQRDQIQPVEARLCRV